MTRRALALVGLILLPASAQDPPSAVDTWGDPLPAGAIARFGSTRFQHADQIQDLFYSADGRKLFTSGWGSIRVWDAATGRLLRKIPGNGGDLESMAVTPDGRTICATGCNILDVRVFDAETGQRKFSLKGFGDDPNFTGGGTAGLAISGDGRRLATMIRDGALRVWDLERGKELFKRTSLAGEKFNYGAGVAISPDGRNVACVAGAATVVLSTETGRTVLKIVGAGTGRAAFSPDGKRIACASKDRGSILIWDLEAGKELQAVEASAGWGCTFAWSPDEKLLAWAEYPAGLRIADVKSGKVLHKFDGLVASTFDFSPNSRVLSVGFQYTVLQYDVTTGREVSEPRRHTHWPSGGASWDYSPDGRMIASAGLLPPIFFWDPLTGQELFRIESPGKKLSLGFSADGRVLSVLEVQWPGMTTVRRYDLVTGRQLTAVDFDAGRLGPSGNRFAAGGRYLGLGPHQGLKLLDSATGRVVREIPTYGYSYGWAMTEDGSRLAVGGGKLGVFDMETGKELWNEPSDGRGSYNDFHFSRNGREIAVGAGNRVRFLDAATGRQLREIPSGLKENPYIQLASLSPDGRSFAMHVWEQKRVFLSNALQAEASRELILTENPWRTMFSPNGDSVAVMCADGTITTWPLKPITPNPPPRPADFVALWERLGSASIVEARKAVRQLTGSGKEAAAWLRDRLKGRLIGPTPPDERMRRLVRDLEAEDIGVRERAVARLRAAGGAAESALLLAGASNPSATATSSIRLLLDELASTPTPPGDPSRFLLSELVLEQIGTPEAVTFLEGLRAKAPTAAERREAAAALDRISRRKD